MWFRLRQRVRKWWKEFPYKKKKMSDYIVGVETDECYEKVGIYLLQARTDKVNILLVNARQMNWITKYLNLGADWNGKVWGIRIELRYEQRV